MSCLHTDVTVFCTGCPWEGDYSDATQDETAPPADPPFVHARFCPDCGSQTTFEPRERKFVWVTNRRPADMADLIQQWIGAGRKYRMGDPVATDTCTVADLKAMGLSGYYLEDVHVP